MKRILLLSIVVLISIPLTTQARSYYSFRYRVRWSMYKQGLISGYVKYSPYAFQYGSTGLVHGNTRYIPYAFSYGKSGLVVDPGGTYFRYIPNRSPQVCVAAKSISSRSENTSSTSTKTGHTRRLVTNKARAEQQKTKRDDPSQVIRAFLKSENVDFRTTRSFQIENKMISIDFILEDKNIIIKYWNPEEIVALVKQEDYRTKRFDKYLASWREYSENFVNAGGNIFQIKSSGKEEILAQLENNDVLNQPEKMYAYAQNDTTNIANP